MPVLIIGSIGLLSVLGMVVLGIAPGGDEGIKETLGEIATMTVIAIAALLRGVPARRE
jgi:hypothetical protein